MPFYLLLYEDTASSLQRMYHSGAILEAETRSHLTEPAGTWILDFVASRTLSDDSILYKLPSLWYPITVAQMD